MVSDHPQRCDLGHAIEAAMSASSAGISARASWPTTWRTATTYWPFLPATSFFWRVWKASGATPFFAANPCPALVSVPSAANAADTGGPTTSSSRSGWRSATCLTITARRRGVPSERTPL